MTDREAASTLARRATRSPWQRHLHAAVIGLVLLVSTASPGCRTGGPAVVLHGSGGPARVSVELALSHEQQARGLMWRTELDDDAGMLFVFDHEREQSFWMRNTPLPLDIIYIGADSKVVSVAANTVPYSQASIPSDGPAKYVLEVNAGFARKNGIGPGTRVELPELPAEAKKAD